MVRRALLEGDLMTGTGISTTGSCSGREEGAQAQLEQEKVGIPSQGAGWVGVVRGWKLSRNIRVKGEFGLSRPTRIMGDSGHTDLAGFLVKSDNAEMNTEIPKSKPS